ncbi:unnamed protein product [Candidula unifasciata]|uniref:Ig-like domain-containing protein n=1 Tax=Candidula unifasciata TaxID=100452 RepID=A0A8S4AAN8_9EUPU|nr:unnamed protein product [Candidula unifasciata]
MVFSLYKRESSYQRLGQFREMLLMLILLQLISPGSGQVAVESCSYNTAHTLANCSSRQLHYVPSTLHKNILTLDISGNNFTVLSNQSFISYNYINNLYLKNNSIHIIESRAFFRLNYITLLDLSNNKLSHIPFASLEVIARSLLYLFLSGNKIQVVPGNMFVNFSNLRLLDLSGNSIHKVDYGAFKGLHSMLEFKIRHNILSFLPPDAFDDFPENINKVQLYDNRWFCDCKLRWLRQWLNNTRESVWDASGYKIRCDGPTIVRERPLDSLSMDELACSVQMKISSSTQEVPKGANITLYCKYSSVPDAEAKWLKNSEIIDVQKNAHKYGVETQILEGHRGERIQQSELRIRDFRYEDIAKYACYVQNIQGFATTEYKRTLEGVPFVDVTPSPNVETATSVLDPRSIVIAVAVVCGIILVIVVSVLVFCFVNRLQRKRQAKKNAIVENVKQHFINNSEATMSNGDINGLNDTKQSNKSGDDKLDLGNDDNRSNSNNTNDSNVTAVKRPLDLGDTEPLYIFEQPESPFTNGNTYVSFGSELTDPGDFTLPPPQYTHTPNTRYESSHAGSATPLLDRYTPSMFDSDEPVEDYAHYPVYDSLTNTLQHPQMDGMYRNGSTSGYSSYRSNDAAKRLSGFHYPPSVNGSMPQTPGSTRSTLALAPRYAESEIDEFYPPDVYHTTPNPVDYRDYQDVGYPVATPPPHRMTPATKKSMSVGNLGYAPLSVGPRKPPRLFQSREYMELTPHEGGSSDYITSPEAQRYSQNYGITPGTPV